MGQFISNFYSKNSTYLNVRQDNLKRMTSTFQPETWKMIDEMAVSMTDWQKKQIPGHTSLYDLFLEAGYTPEDVKKIHKIVIQGSQGLLLTILRGEKVCQPSDDECKLSVKNLFAFRGKRRSGKKSMKRTIRKSPKKSRKTTKRSPRKRSPRKH